VRGGGGGRYVADDEDNVTIKTTYNNIKQYIVIIMVTCERWCGIVRERERNKERINEFKIKTISNRERAMR